MSTWTWAVCSAAEPPSEPGARPPRSSCVAASAATYTITVGAVNTLRQNPAKGASRPRGGRAPARGRRRDAARRHGASSTRRRRPGDLIDRGTRYPFPFEGDGAMGLFGGKGDASGGMKPGFRDFKWGERPGRRSMEVLDEHAESKFCWIPNDDLTFAGAARRQDRLRVLGEPVRRGLHRDVSSNPPTGS